MPFALDVRVPLPKPLARLEIRKQIRALMKVLSIDDRELSVVLCDDETIHALNRDFRHKDKPTDVLAFALSEGEFGTLAGPLLGDVVISIDTTVRQAATAGKTASQELAMLLVHGTLHLLGWDHETAKKDRLMRAETDRLLVAIGVDPSLGTAEVKRSTASKSPVLASTKAKPVGASKRSAGGVRAPGRSATATTAPKRATKVTTKSKGSVKK